MGERITAAALIVAVGVPLSIALDVLTLWLLTRTAQRRRRPVTWRTSTRSNPSGNCVQVAVMTRGE